MHRQLAGTISRILLGTILLCLLIVFTSHSQTSWQTTQTNINSHDFGSCVLARNLVRVKAFPAYLDVEDEAEIGTGGTVRVGNDPNALEITGTFSLPVGATIVGSLLWDGNRILQGKLLDRQRADSLYEAVVDRDAIIPPPRPRDPLLLEFLGNGRYRFKIFPVSLGHSRRFRIRYQLPPTMGVDGLETTLRTAIAPLFPSASTGTSITLSGGGGVTSVILAEGTFKRELQMPRTIFVAANNLGQYPSSPVRVLPATPVFQTMVTTSFSTGAFTGHYLNLYAAVPGQVKNFGRASSAMNVSVTVRNSGRAYDFPIPCQGSGSSAVCANLVFHGKSSYGWSTSLDWEAFDATGNSLGRTTMRPTLSGNAGDTSIAVLWAGSGANAYSEKVELPLGPVYGFVDQWASLLALESDSLNQAGKLAYSDSGVPRIVNENLADVIPNYNGQMPPCCQGTPIIKDLKTALTDVSTWRVNRGRDGMLTLQIPGMTTGSRVEIELYDPSGRRIGVWNLETINGRLQWSISGIRPGLYMLKIRIAGQTATKRIML